MRKILLDQVEIQYASSGKTLAFHLEIPLFPQGFTVLRGASGCGKTTAMRAMAGLVPLWKGEILGIDPQKTAMMFQENRLFPWRSVAQQISDVCPPHKAQPQAFLDAVGLGGEGAQMPKTLSGGMARRVALARTLAYGKGIDCQVYILDEPFTGVDPQRVSQLIQLCKDLPVPVVLTSHLPGVWDLAEVIVDL